MARRKKFDDLWEADLLGCWVWNGKPDKNGYGRFGRQGAHLYAYKRACGDPPPGMQVDHLCTNRRCVRPGHLKAVTHRENVLRSQAPPAKNARKTHCHWGHPFDDLNTRRLKDGRRMCRACARRHQHALRRRRKAARLVLSHPAKVCEQLVLFAPEVSTPSISNLALAAFSRTGSGVPGEARWPQLSADDASELSRVQGHSPPRTVTRGRQVGAYLAETESLVI